MNSFLHRLAAAKLSQTIRLLLLLAVYSAVLVGSLYLCYQLRFEFALPDGTAAQFLRSARWLVPLSLGALWLAGQFRSLLSYFSLPDMVRVGSAQAIVSIIAVGIWYATGGSMAPPRSIILTNLVISSAGLVTFRLGLRMLRERYHRAPSAAEQRIRRVGIIGATDMGAHLAKEMKNRPNMHMQPVAFFDAEPKRWGRQIHGVPIIGSHELLFVPQHALNLSEVIVARSDLTPAGLRQIVHQLSHAGIKCEVAPSTEEIVSGTNRLQAIRPVEIEDLLGREAVNLQTDLIGHLIAGKCVLVTGAGGSIGGELCRQILGYQPRQLVLVEQCEVQLFSIEQELVQMSAASAVVVYVADILDDALMRTIFERHRPEIVFHAAAHKHVPMMEHQPAEAFQNNVIGTIRVATIAGETGTDRFVLISSDKAINPTNVMGATKRLAEIYLQARQADRCDSTRYLAVRFGNVLASSGSVVPTFKRQIAAGGPVTVTHPEVTRYFMTIPEAAGLVLQSATQGTGGEIFVLDMGTPIKIVDLARQLIELSGLQPGTDIEIKFTGLRPGEKLYEELTHTAENHAPTHHPKIMRFVSAAAKLPPLVTQLVDLHSRRHQLSANAMKEEIRSLVPEYRPYLGGRS